jgi:dihydrofolate reductase
MNLAIIVATDLNNAIGKNNQLLWHLPADLKFFKTNTLGCPIIMGRKTFESIGKALPGRKNIVITRSKKLKIEGVFIASSLSQAFEMAGDGKAFVIGGAEIYKQALPHVHEIFRTIVKETFDADTFFPEIKTNEFKLVWEECHQPDEKNKYEYCFQKWQHANRSGL